MYYNIVCMFLYLHVYVCMYIYGIDSCIIIYM